MPKKQTWRCDLPEVIVIVLLCVVATGAITRDYSRGELNRLWSYARYPLDERDALVAKYGSKTYALGVDEWVIRDYFQDQRDGVFVDVGASHYLQGSNTYFLETQLGWSGVAIDALPEFGPDYQKHRPRTRFVAMFAADKADQTVQFYVPADNPFVASQDRDLAHRESEGQATTARTVPTTTLNVVLEQAGIHRIDLLNMDIELAEPAALAGFDVDRYRPRLVCIEAHPPVRQQILDYFSDHGYALIGKYLRVDSTNLYFEPKRTAESSRAR